jgi:TolA-binding protein
MNLSESITQMRVALDTAEAEIKSLEGGRKAASARARKSLQSIKGEAHTLRKAITTHTKGMPIKSRSKAEPVVHSPTAAAVLAEELETKEPDEPKAEPKPKRKPRAKKA